MDNANSQEYLEKIQIQVIENLKQTTTHAPSVQMTEVPRNSIGMNDEDDAALDDLDEDTHPDERKTKRQWDKYIEREGELSESEDEEENERHGVRRQRGMKKRRNMMDYQNPVAAPDDEEMVSDAVSPPSGNANGTAARTANGSSNQDDEDMSDGNSQSHSGLGDDDSDMDDHHNLNGHENTNPDHDEEDLEMMEDDAVDAPSNANVVAPTAPNVPAPSERQEATPPDSPPQVAAQPLAPTQQAAADVGNDAMDEGVTIEEDPEMVKEETLEERDRENVQGEKAAEIAERKEE